MYLPTLNRFLSARENRSGEPNQLSSEKSINIGVRKKIHSPSGIVTFTLRVQIAYRSMYNEFIYFGHRMLLYVLLFRGKRVFGVHVVST